MDSRKLLRKLSSRHRDISSTPWEDFLNNGAKNFLLFLKSIPICRNILQELRHISGQQDYQKRVESLQFGDSIAFENDPEGVGKAAFGLYILEHYSDDYYKFRHFIIQRQWTSSRGYEAQIREAKKRLVTPLYNFVVERVEESQGVDTPDDIIGEAIQYTDDLLARYYPKVAADLREAYKITSEAMGTENPKEHWKNVGRICRDVLQNLAEAIWKPEYTPEDTPEPTRQEFTNRIKYTLRFFIKQEDDYSDSHRQNLERLCKAICDYAQGLTHAQHANERQAKRTLLYTYLVINDILYVIFDG